MSRGNGTAKASTAIPLEEVLGLEAINQASTPTFPELLGRLWDARFCGSVTLHFAGGKPLAVVLQQETRVPLLTEGPKSSVD